MLSGGKSGFDPTSDLEIKESVASEIGRRGSGRPVRELGTDTKRRFEVVLISDGEEMDGGNDSSSRIIPILFNLLSLFNSSQKLRILSQLPNRPILFLFVLSFHFGSFIFLVIRISPTEIARGRGIKFGNVSWNGNRFMRLELKATTRLTRKFE